MLQSDKIAPVMKRADMRWSDVEHGCAAAVEQLEVVSARSVGSEEVVVPVSLPLQPGVAWRDLVSDRRSGTPSEPSGWVTSDGCIERKSVGTSQAAPDCMRLPTPRGPLSDFVISAFKMGPGSLGPTPPVAGRDELCDDDFELALYLCYELHYVAIAEPSWEWDPGLLGFRAELERRFIRRLRDELGDRRPGPPAEVGRELEDLLDQSSGPSLSTYLCESGTLDELREFCVHRSAYQLKEADPHSFGIPRLRGAAKAAMVEIQYDEYGSGDATQMHSELFGTTMSALGLDPTYGTYLDHLPGVTLATVNLVSLFGLHRRWRAALVGHLAVFEMTSVEPMGRYSDALRRLGIGAEGRRFYDVHVDADTRHGAIARDRMVPGLMEAEPDLAGDLLFGAASVLLLEERFARHLLNAWSLDRTSLIPWGMRLRMPVPHSSPRASRSGREPSHRGDDDAKLGSVVGAVEVRA